jgi:threonine synthase
MDTHTAVASHVLKEYREKTGDMTTAVIVSTASPYKFAQDVLSAVEGKEAVNGLDAFQCSEMLEKVTGVKVPQQVKELRTLPVRHKQQCQKDKMAEAVMEAFSK